MNCNGNDIYTNIVKRNRKKVNDDKFLQLKEVNQALTIMFTNPYVL